MQNLFLMQEVMLSTPTDLLYEKHIFELYFAILNIIETKMTTETTLEDDLNLLRTDDLSWEMKMAVTYRFEKKKIIKSQMNIVRKTLDIITCMKDVIITEELSANPDLQNKAYT